MKRADAIVTIDTRRARVFVLVLRLIAPIVGYERATRWAIAGSYRLSRYRIGRGPWRSCAELRD